MSAIDVNWSDYSDRSAAESRVELPNIRLSYALSVGTDPDDAPEERVSAVYLSAVDSKDVLGEWGVGVKAVPGFHPVSVKGLSPEDGKAWCEGQLQRFLDSQ